MSKTKKKIFFGTGTAISFALLVNWLWQNLLTNTLMNATDAQTEIFTRASYPNGFLLVVLIPIIATALLFVGIIRKK